MFFELFELLPLSGGTVKPCLPNALPLDECEDKNDRPRSAAENT